MRQSGRVVRQVLDHLPRLGRPGATTVDLERAARTTMKDSARSRLQGLLRLSLRLCTSVNEDYPRHTVRQRNVECRISVRWTAIVLDGYSAMQPITCRSAIEVTEECGSCLR